MRMDPKILRILDRAQAGTAPAKADCVALLDCAPSSLEAAVTRGVADSLARARFGNEAMLMGQIGIEIAACPGRCKFCAFSRDHTPLTPGKLSIDEILAGANPRDTEAETAGHRGRDVLTCETMLREAGFEYLLTAPGERRPMRNPAR